jgi:hypothetical protein
MREKERKHNEVYNWRFSVIGNGSWTCAIRGQVVWGLVFSVLRVQGDLLDLRDFGGQVVWAF